MSTTTVEFRTLDKSETLPANYVNPYYLADLKRRVTVARVGGKLSAFDEAITHQACPSIRPGLPTGSTRKCQCHGSQFDVRWGAVLKGPAQDPLTSYEVGEQNGEIQVRV